MALTKEEMDDIGNLLSQLNSNKWEKAMEQISDEAPDMLRALLEDINQLRGERDAWKVTSMQSDRNTNYYRGLLKKVSKHLGPDVFVQDDGGVVDSPLLAKVPELVEKLSSDLVLEVASGDMHRRIVNEVAEALGQSFGETTYDLEDKVQKAIATLKEDRDDAKSEWAALWDALREHVGHDGCVAIIQEERRRLNNIKQARLKIEEL